MFGELRLATFDHVQAEQVGVRVEVVQGVLVLLLSIVVVISLRAVGTIMAVTLLVTPVAYSYLDDLQLKLRRKRIETLPEFHEPEAIAK